MVSQYDAIGAHYERVKNLPVGLAEQATLRAALPDLTGRSVLDVGSGTGFYPRIYASLGASSVVGVDASAEMTAYATAVEERERAGIRYATHDAMALPRLGDFDVVTAVWLLGYAEGGDGLDTMLAHLVANLTNGGDLVVLVPNLVLDQAVLRGYRPYGLIVTMTGTSAGRQGYHVRVDGETPIYFDGFAFPIEVIEAALRRAGLTDIQPHPMVTPPDAVAGHDDRFWADLAANPTFAVFTATKP